MKRVAEINKIRYIEDKMQEYFQQKKASGFTIPRRIIEAKIVLNDLDENSTLEELQNSLERAIELLPSRKNPSFRGIYELMDDLREDLQDSLEIEESIQTIEFG